VPVLPEHQFAKVPVSFARVPAASLPVERNSLKKTYHTLNLTKHTALFQIIKRESILTQKKMLKYIAMYD
jgi:hypothetical protein